MNAKQRRKMMRKPDDLIERRAALDAKAHDEDTFRVTISTDRPVAGLLHEREVLSHDGNAVDLARAQRKGLPVTIGHDRNALPVGRVDELELVEGTLRGRMRLSRNHQHLASDIDDGIVTDGSVGARVARGAWKETGRDLVATRWSPVHFALVAAGADPAASVSRVEDQTMGDNSEQVVTRAQEISALFAGLDGAEWVKLERDALRGDESPDHVAGLINTRLRDIAREVQKPSATRIESGADELENWCNLVELQLEVRAGLVSAERRESAYRELQAAGMGDLTLRELARDYARLRNLPTGGTQAAIIGRALNTPGVLRTTFSHTTSDFSNLLAATADKSLARGYTENEETFRAWTRNESLSNFRSHSFPALSSFSDLELVPESGSFQHGTFSDKAETMQLSTYGKMFSLGRQMIANDDIGMVSRIPIAMGRAAARQVGDLVYAVLTANGTMAEDATALFDAATHSNLATPGAAISTATLDAGRVAMRTQTAPAPGDASAGATLNTAPVFLLVPAGVETAARVQIASEKDPGEGATTSFDAANPFRSALTVIAEARLDSDDANAWYLAAGPAANVETVSVGWLNGQQRPVVDSQSGFEQDGITYKVRIDCDAAALDWRGLYKNEGGA